MLYYLNLSLCIASRARIRSYISVDIDHVRKTSIHASHAVGPYNDVMRLCFLHSALSTLPLGLEVGIWCERWDGWGGGGLVVGWWWGCVWGWWYGGVGGGGVVGLVVGVAVGLAVGGGSGGWWGWWAVGWWWGWRAAGVFAKYTQKDQAKSMRTMCVYNVHAVNKTQCAVVTPSFVPAVTYPHLIQTVFMQNPACETHKTALDGWKHKIAHTQ